MNNCVKMINDSEYKSSNLVHRSGYVERRTTYKIIVSTYSILINS